MTTMNAPPPQHRGPQPSLARELVIGAFVLLVAVAIFAGASSCSLA